jgi:predicted peptidase
MRIMRTFVTAAAIAAVASSVAAETTESGFLNRSAVVDGTEYRYEVYIPRAYRDTVASPLILALHGVGECGDDGQLQTDVGLARALRQHADRYPAIVVFPQAPVGASWQHLGARIALAALDTSLDEFNVDASCVYLTGLSMGGNGCWYLAYHNPDRFAALVVICGWVSALNVVGTDYPAIAPSPAVDPFGEVARQVSRLPIWIFHGDADPIVPVEESRGMASALRAAGANVSYTELPGIGHNAWDPAYGSPELPSWLLKQRRP